MDFHGLKAAQAALRLENLLETWVRLQPGAVLRIITGRGNRSPDGPVLLELVGDLLRDEMGGRIADVARDAGGGGWLVRLGGGRE